MATILEQCQIQPSPSPNNDFSLPLTHFDIPFLTSFPTQRLMFFRFPCSNSNRLIPQLKESLTATISDFLPLAGNVVLPMSSDTPSIVFHPGNSVHLTVSECHKDFDHISSNNPRVADVLYCCVPHLPGATCGSGSVSFPVLSLQITLFPGQGICIGLTNHHAVADESSIVHFVKSWAYRNSGFGTLESSPSFQRRHVQDPGEFRSRAWKTVTKNGMMKIFPRDFVSPVTKIRATFVLSRDHVQILKKYVLINRPNISYISCFSIISAYIWTCSEKSFSKADENEPVYFGIPVECRGRITPPLLENFFGNCILFAIAESTHGLITENHGFVTASECIGEAIRKTVKSGGGILGTADWPLDFGKFAGKRTTSVAGSPRFDVYEVDYGWGRPNKYEFVHIDRETSFSLIKSREFEGAFEIGLSRTKDEMDVFQNYFFMGLQNL